MKLTLELTRDEIEQILLNHAKRENGLRREDVTIEWTPTHDLTIIQDDSATPEAREWLETNGGSDSNDSN